MIRLTAVAASLLVALLVTRATDGGDLSVRYERGRLSVTAEMIPLAEVLREFGRQVGLTVTGAEDLREPISVRFSNLSPYEALRRLLVHVSHVIVVEPTPLRGEPRLTHVQVFGTRGARSSATPSSPVEVAAFGEAALTPGVTDDPEAEPSSNQP